MAEIDVGRLLKDIRQQGKVSQRMLAELSGVNRSYINQIEGGKVKSITLGMANRLATALGVSPSVFFGEQGPIAPELTYDVEAIPRYTEHGFRPRAGESTEPVDHIYRRRVGPTRQSLEAYIIKGGCLTPRVPDGSTIIVDREANIDYGNIVACRIEGRFHLGHLRKIGDEVYVENNHGRYKAENCHPIARVVQIVTDV